SGTSRVDCDCHDLLKSQHPPRPTGVQHTALVLAASPPRSLPSLSAALVDPAYPLAALGALTVVEQSLGQVPQMRTYDLGAMSEGEVWIYRPAALREVVGVEELRAEWPDDAGIKCWSVGELE
ncbi:hypothetical protein JCM21900_001814, partial [Sporobolomyces salmonicolor]